MLQIDFERMFSGENSLGCRSIYGIVQQTLRDSFTVLATPDLAAAISALVVDPRYAVDDDQRIRGVSHRSPAFVFTSFLYYPSIRPVL